MSDAEVSRLFRHDRESGSSIDEALVELRRLGATQIQAVKALREVEGMDVGEAKRIVDSSTAWRDARESAESLRASAAKALHWDDRTMTIRQFAKVKVLVDRFRETDDVEPGTEGYVIEVHHDQ